MSCAHKIQKVLETRRDDGCVYRRRRCMSCNAVWWTGERKIDAPPEKFTCADRFARMRDSAPAKARAANDDVAPGQASAGAQRYMQAWGKK